MHIAGRKHCGWANHTKTNSNGGAGNGNQLEPVIQVVAVVEVVATIGTAAPVTTSKLVLVAIPAAERTGGEVVTAYVVPEFTANRSGRRKRHRSHGPRNNSDTGTEEISGAVISPAAIAGNRLTRPH